MTWKSLAAAAVLLALSGSSRLGAQRLETVAGDRARLLELTGDTALAPSASRHSLRERFPALDRVLAPRDIDLRAEGPELRVVWNSAIPYSINDGPLWAGRGASVSITGGLTTARAGRTAAVAVTLAPTLVYSQNLPFQIRPDTSTGRSAFASPFHVGPFSADLPQRFGDRHVLAVDPGRSAVWLSLARITMGATAATETWGPAVRNPLVMSANAAGIPRLVVATRHPLRTPVGSFDARLISGSLTESLFFDGDPGNDLRGLSGALIRFVPAFDSALSIGLERVVYRPARSHPGTAVFSRALDALVHWERLRAPDDSAPQRADQILGLFARWLAPRAGLEVYGEWARLDLPRSPGELLTAAHHTLGYTVGAQWAPPRSTGRLRLQLELTNLEQSRVIPDRAPVDFYTARSNPHGFTNRGQVIGAAIGPGASSQWLAIDRFAPAWQLGWYAGRIRWENDAMYREALPHLFLHDVTVYTGLRGARRTPWTDVSLDVTFGYRFNYLFQNGIPQPSGFAFRTVDVRNLTVALGATPR